MMQLPLIAPLPFGKVTSPDAFLSFSVRQVNGHQARLRERVALHPDIDLNNYRFKAVIDWMDVRIRLGRGTQHQWVQKVLEEHLPRVSWIKSVDAGPGSVARVFDIRVQDPPSLAKLVMIDRALAKEFDLTAPTVIKAIEVSLDIYPRSPSAQACVMMLGVLQRTIFTSRDILSDYMRRPECSKGSNGDGEDMRRSINGGPDVEGHRFPWMLPANHLAPWVDATTYIGTRGDEVMMRIMHKTIDRQRRQEGLSHILPEDEKRARIEVTLQENELRAIGVETFDDMLKHGFTRFHRSYFQFKLPTFRSPEGEEAVPAVVMRTEHDRASAFLRSGIIGLGALDSETRRLQDMHWPRLREMMKELGRPLRRRRDGSGETGRLIAYDDLNRKASLALRHLMDREDRAARRFLRTVPVEQTARSV